MRRAATLALVLLGVASLNAPAVASDPEASSQEASIAAAAIAPLRDALARNAAALCADFVPSVAAQLVPTAAPSVGCQAAAEQVFASAAPDEPPTLETPVLGHALKVERLEVTGTRATITIDPTAPLTVKLEELGSSWLVSSDARLGAIVGCRLLSAHDCAPDSKVVVFSYGEGTAEPPLSAFAPVPAAVKRTGTRETHEFEAGRTVFAQSGCLACHRLDHAGNRQPGQNLTHIGATLSRAQIEHAIVDPRTPMPSFKNLPPRKLHDVVRFLSLLR
jgi:Cytochrome C oxidase, cbb3-type, subunit III